LSIVPTLNMTHPLRKGGTRVKQRRIIRSSMARASGLSMLAIPAVKQGGSVSLEAVF